MRIPALILAGAPPVVEGPVLVGPGTPADAGSAAGGAVVVPDC